MTEPQVVLDEYAADVPYEDLAGAFLEFNRPPGDDPVLLVAEAAASTTGQSYVDGIQSTVERFEAAFVETGWVESLADLAALDPDEEDLVEAFGAERKRTVLNGIATHLSSSAADDDLAALQNWAARADHYQYEEDPIGAISGVGPSTFQYLRILAGMPVAKPDPQLEELLEAVGSDLGREDVAAATGLRAIAAAEWLSLETTYSMLEIDQIAWYLHSDPEDRDAVLAES